MTEATVHWYTEFNDGPSCSRRRNGATTTDPDAVTCRQSSCQTGASRERTRRVKSARVDHPSLEPGGRFSATTPPGATVAALLMDGRPWLHDITYEDAHDLIGVLGSVIATLHERDRERIDAAAMARIIEDMRHELETSSARREVPSE